MLLCTAAAFSQTTCNPDDKIYEDLEIWENRGYIKNLPPLRPYPLNLIKGFLNTVKAEGSDHDSSVAESYLENLESKYNTSLKVSVLTRFSEDSDYYGETGINAGLESVPYEKVSLSGDINCYFLDQESGDLLPENTRPAADKQKDWSDVDLMGKNFKIQQGLSTLLAFGNEKTYFQTGIVRNSFGPFQGDSAVLSSSAPQTGHFSFTWREEAFVFNTALLELTASDDTGDGVFPEKYFAIHSIFFHPTEKIELGFFESVVFGGRFEPMYVMPFSEFFYSQGFLGFPDNSLMGFSIKVKMPKDLVYKFLLYADDLHFNDMVRFDFDTKYKLAFQTGISWLPEYRKIRKISIDYLLVTPYMYTHKTESETAEDPNYLNYTHQGVNLGPDLDPNSDRITLSVVTEPVEKLFLEFRSRFIRHGNGSVDGDENVGEGDGSLFDDGYNETTKEYTFQDTTRFMTQDVIEKIFQNGIQAEYSWDFSKKTVKASAGYTLEFINNKDLTNEDEWNHIFSIGTTLSF